MAKKTRVTIETETLLVLRAQKQLRAWCPQCGAEVEMIRLDEAGVISNLSPAGVEAWMPAENLHRCLSVDGALLVCLDSMLKRPHRTRGADPSSG